VDKLRVLEGREGHGAHEIASLARGIAHAVREVMRERYIPLLAIGRGGMGRIDLALAVGLPGAEQLVVLKRLRDGVDLGADAGKELVREAHLTARLMHPNIAATLGLDVMGGELVVVLEYLEGASLSMLARRCEERGTTMPAPILLRIVRDALAGLGHAHELRDYDGSPLGIVHRDVSPANVLVTAEGVTKVLDFGIAKATSRSTTLTPPGYVKGKLGYMPPEQIVGLGVDLRADLYAAGVILWEGLARRRFSTTDDIERCIAQRLESDAPSVRSVVPAIPSSLDDIVRRCLARDPLDRWPSANELRAALDAHVATHGGDATTKDVARFVDDLCGESLRARRTILRDRFAQLAAGRPSTTARMPSMAADRASTSPVAIDVFRPSVVDVPQARAPVVSARVTSVSSTRWVLPVCALFVGAALSLLGGEVAARIEHVRVTFTGSPRATTSRTAEIVEATNAGRARVKAEAPPPVEAAPAGVPVRARAAMARPASTSLATTDVAPPSTATTPAATGFATIDSYPWSRVTIDGAVVGVTPIVRTPLEAGRHVVVLENPEQGRHELAVTVKDGETTAERWRW